MLERDQILASQTFCSLYATFKETSKQRVMACLHRHNSINFLISAAHAFHTKSGAEPRWKSNLSFIWYNLRRYI